MYRGFQEVLREAFLAGRVQEAERQQQGSRARYLLQELEGYAVPEK